MKNNEFLVCTYFSTKKLSIIIIYQMREYSLMDQENITGYGYMY